MKLAIVSDVHDRLRLFSKCIDYLNSVKIDLLIHCGDWDMPFSTRPLARPKFPIKAALVI
ncbi:MAG: metallophosphoesterase family protein [Paludibacteraceae bacterium]|nr:metallophosphoesterase family protein [Paludibacteraceae bacterium]